MRELSKIKVDNRSIVVLGIRPFSIDPRQVIRNDGASPALDDLSQNEIGW
jgi:hypothetical protein